MCLHLYHCTAEYHIYVSVYKCNYTYMYICTYVRLCVLCRCPAARAQARVAVDTALPRALSSAARWPRPAPVLTCPPSLLERKAARFETCRQDRLVQQGLGVKALVGQLLCGLDTLVPQLHLVQAAVVVRPENQAARVRGGGLAHDGRDAVALREPDQVEGVDVVGVGLGGLGVVLGGGLSSKGGVCLLRGVRLIGVGAHPVPHPPAPVGIARFPKLCPRWARSYCEASLRASALQKQARHACVVHRYFYTYTCIHCARRSHELHTEGGIELRKHHNR